MYTVCFFLTIQHFVKPKKKKKSLDSVLMLNLTIRQEIFPMIHSFSHVILDIINLFLKYKSDFKKNLCDSST